MNNSLADIFRKYNRNMFCRMKKELTSIDVTKVNEWVDVIQKIPVDVRVCAILGLTAFCIADRYISYLEANSAMAQDFSYDNTTTIPLGNGIVNKRSFTKNSAN